MTRTIKSSRPMNYDGLVAAIKDIHGRMLGRAAASVNQGLVLRNWFIGAYLVEFEQNGEDRAKYGEVLVNSLALDLGRSGLTGMSARNLRSFRQFYVNYPQIWQTLSAEFRNWLPEEIWQTLSAKSKGRMAPIGQTASVQSVKTLPRPTLHELLQLSWSHLLELCRIEDVLKQTFYERECLKGRWSVRQLKRQIDSLLFERTGLSTDKSAVVERAHGQETVILEPEDVLRDPYVLEFAGLAECPTYTEHELESALLDHLQSFLLELGTGFCFEARQKRITVGTEHDRVDLVFYHRKLRCHVLIDLKIRAFRHGDAGQMNYYLNYYRANEMQSGDNPPVGLLLCSDKDETRVEYATAGMDNYLFVSRYLLELPKPEEIQAFLQADRERIEQAIAKDTP